MGDSLTDLTAVRHKAILAEPLSGEDWSAGVVPRATLADLDPVAIAKAREKYGAKHQQERWAAEISGWSTEAFLDRAKITLHGQITRTALLLLGQPQSVGPVAQQHGGNHMESSRGARGQTLWPTLFADHD